MYKGQKIIAIIPARANSKGIPGKNMKQINGMPLIGFSLAAAISSDLLDEVIFSSDSQEMIDFAKNLGAYAPFVRPSELSEDHSSSTSVVVHALDWLEKHENKTFDYVMLIQPTTPFVMPIDIDNAIIEIIDHGMDSVFAVRETADHPIWVNTLDGHSLKPVLNRPIKSSELRRQDVGDVYIYNGAVYLTSVKSMMLHQQFFFGTQGYTVMPKYRSVDIDEQLDLIFAKVLVESGFFKDEVEKEFGSMLDKRIPSLTRSILC